MPTFLVWKVREMKPVNTSEAAAMADNHLYESGNQGYRSGGRGIDGGGRE